MSKINVLTLVVVVATIAMLNQAVPQPRSEDIHEMTDEGCRDYNVF
jgi:hypothetical protein